MKDKTSFKYIARKGEELELDLSSKRSFTGTKNLFRAFDKLLFSKPNLTFSFLILFVALPVSLFITLKTDILGSNDELGGAKLEVKMPEVEDVSLHKETSYEIEVAGTDLEELSIIEIDSPTWFLRGRELDWESSDGRRHKKSLKYTGTIENETTERFGLLIKGTMDTEGVCVDDCDLESNVYDLVEFNLNSNVCTDSAVWARYPLGKVDGQDSSSICKKFENSCLVSSSWKSYDSLEECEGSQNPPIFDEYIEDIVIEVETDCEGEVIKSQLNGFEKVVKAKDSDGDLVRFSIKSTEGFAELRQDSVETIVKQISGAKGVNYFEYSYSAVIEGDLDLDMLGDTYQIELSACDLHDNCTDTDFTLSLVKKSVCEFELPKTGGSVEVEVVLPKGGEEVQGVYDTLVYLNGTDIYDLKVDLYNENCKESQDYIANIEKYSRLDLDQDKGVIIEFDSRAFRDEEYCIKVFAKDSDTENSYWVDSSSVKFKIRNSNQDPRIESKVPSTNIVTGEDFKYQIETLDPDGDEVSLDLIAKPEWLNLEANTLSGSTDVPGTYYFQIIADDGNNGKDSQQIVINVNPPLNNHSQIEFEYPQKNSVLAGKNNNIKWSVSDSDEIANIKLYYSHHDTEWKLIGTYNPNSDNANWDLTGIEDGEYSLKLLVQDKSDMKVKNSLVSNKFFVASSILGKTKSQLTMPAIVDLMPTPDSNVETMKPMISANLYPSSNASFEFEDIDVYLDDKSIINHCELEEERLSCLLENEVETGRHKIRMDVEDTKTNSMTEEWYFNIVDVQEDGTIEDETVEVEYVLLPIINLEVEKSALIVSIVLFSVAFVMILVPYAVYLLWTRRSRNRGIAQAAPAEVLSPTPVTGSGSSKNNTYIQQNQGVRYVSRESLPHGYKPKSSK